MRSWRINGKIIILFSLFLSLSACLYPKYKLDNNLFKSVEKSELLKLPNSYRIVHRVRLKIRKQSFDFIGYLAVNRDCYRAVALSEIGGKIFDLINCSGKQTVVKSPLRFPAKPLISGVLKELGYIFAQQNIIEADKVRDNKAVSNILIQVKKKNGNKEIKNNYDPENKISILIMEKDRLFSRIEISSFRTVKDWLHPIPDKILIKNVYWGYTMQIELIRFDNKPVGKNVFKQK